MNIALFMDDPEWAKCVPDRSSGGPACGLPTHEDCEPLDVDCVAHHLQPDGTLGAAMKTYEARPGQIDALRAVTRAFNDRSHLMIEAGTGVGKSLAYLIPAVQWASLNDTPVIITTATRNLQSQLIATDIPRALKTLGEKANTFRVALLKGRANYLCLREMGEFMQSGWYALSEAERAEFEMFVAWLHETKDGDLDTFSGELFREHLSCAGEDCGGRRCPFYNKCFVMKARERARRAHLIVANHALVLTEASTGGSGLLPSYGRIIFDEAHNLEAAATNFLSFEISQNVLASLLNKIDRKGKARRGLKRIPARGLLGSVMRQLERGALAESNAVQKIIESVNKIRTAAANVFRAGEALLETASRLFTPVPTAEILRYRTVDETRQYAANGLFATYAPEQWDEEELKTMMVRFEDRLAKLANELITLSNTLLAAPGEGGLPLFADLAGLASAVADSLRDYMMQVKAVLSGSDPERVSWIAKTKKGPALYSAPLSVAADMNKLFYQTKDSVILCSATLRCGNTFSYMARKLGMDLVESDRRKCLVAASPFDYLRQALALAPDFLPDPSSVKSDYPQMLAPFLCKLFVETRGRALVLFTSYEMMCHVADVARNEFHEAGIELLVQGEGPTREEMVRRLKKASAPLVLFGAQSFWEGVDVPGEALSCVVIARLPFPQAGDPIVEARTEKIESEGGNSFRDYMLPEAVIRFRQGFGRLIRSKADRGIVIIADSRIATKNYGMTFRKSVAASIHAVSVEDNLFARVKQFMDES